MSKLYIIILLFTFPVFAEGLDKCGNNKQARLLVNLIKADKDQKRTNIRCNSMLTDAAAAQS